MRKILTLAAFLICSITMSFAQYSGSGSGTQSDPPKPITFADPAVESLCVANWDTNHNGVLTMVEAAAVTSLGEVFKGNTEITSFDELQYFTGLTSIGNGAFDYCSNLTSVTIPESVTSIGDYAFFNCHLTTLTIPSNITSIGTGAFLDCGMALNSITVESGNTKYDSRDNCNAIIETATNKLLWGCNNTVIPNTVTSIGNSAFSHCMELSSINIPDGVTAIGSWAFYCCDNLQYSVKFYNYLQNIDLIT